MDSLTIVEYFNEIEDVAPGFLPRPVATMMDQFGFQGCEEALHRCVVVSVAGAAHADDRLGIFQYRQVVATGELTPAVGVMEQSSRRSPASECHLERFDSQGVKESGFHGPAHDPAGVEVQNSREIEPASLVGT